MTPLRLVLGSADLADDEHTDRLLDQFYDAGGRALDVANVYGDGDSERAIGRWLRRRNVRDVVLYAKGCHPPHCEPRLVRQEVEHALSNLGVERLDVFLLHRDDARIPIDAWVHALRSELDRGTVLAVGASNWTLERFEALRMQFLPDNAVAAFSSHFSLAEMAEPPWPGCLAADARTVRKLAAAGVTVLAWASLAAGYLAGNGRSDRPAERSWQTPANERRRARAAELARELGATSAAVAIAYVLAHDGVRPVVGTRSAKHLADVIAAETIDLSGDQTAWLEAGVET